MDKNEDLTDNNLFEGTSSDNIEVKPTEIKEENSNTYDLQKELEAKFDELFGAFEDSND